MKISMIKCMAALSILMIPNFLTISPSEARRMGPRASGEALQQCMLSNDAQMGDNSMFFGCCSKDAGICVICDKPPSPTGNDSCNVVNYRRAELGGTKSLSKQGFSNKYKK